jgi:hypothetical protein
MAQDWKAEQKTWLAEARAAGPGYRVWRWHEVIEPERQEVCHFKLLAPGEKLPDGAGVVVEP